MPEFGLLQGLAVSGNYDQKINELHYREEANRRAAAESENKAKLFADDLDFQNAANEHDAPLIKSYAKDQIKKIGSFVRENPDWVYNTDKRLQLNMMKKELKDNPELTRGLTSDASFKALNGDLQEVAKNPNMHDTEAYQDLLRQKQNYLQYGNQNGLEAFQKEGKKSFVYTKPQDFIDINKSFSDVGTKFNDMLVKKINGGGLGSYEEYANPNSLKTVAMQMYSQNKRQFDKLAAKEGLDPIKYIETGINAHVPKKRDFGDYGLLKQQAEHAYQEKKDRIKAGQLSPEANSYEIEIAKKNHSMVTPDQMRELVDSDSQTFLYDNSGKKKIDLTGSLNSKVTGYNFYPDPDGKDLTLKGKKYAEAYAYISFKKAVELGIVKDATEGLDLWMGDDEVKDEYKNNVSIETKEDKDGNSQKAVKIRVFQPFDVNNSANAGRFNSKVMTSKQQPLPQESYQTQQKQFPEGSQVDAVGNVFLNGKFIGKQ